MKSILRFIIKHRITTGVCISLLTLVISLSIAELFVRHLMPQNTFKIARSIGLNIYKPGDNIPFTLEPNVKNYHHIAFTREFDTYVSTNSLGTRGSQFAQPKPSSTYRILFLGDSMTFGWGVNDNDTYAYLTGENLNKWAKENNIDKKFEVINAGFADGKTLDSYYVYLKDTALKFEPDLIIAGFFPYNDISDLLEFNWDKIDDQGLPIKISSKIESLDHGHVVSKNNQDWIYQIPVLRNSHLAILMYSSINKRLPASGKVIKRIMGLKTTPPLLSDDQPQKCIHSLAEKDCPQILINSYNTSKKLLLGINQLAINNQKILIVTVMIDPVQANTLSILPNMIDRDQPQKDIRQFLENEKIPYFDFAPALSGLDTKSFFYEKDGHLNKIGNQKAADSLSSYLENYFLKAAIFKREYR